MERKTGKTALHRKSGANGIQNEAGKGEAGSDALRQLRETELRISAVLDRIVEHLENESVSQLSMPSALSALGALIDKIILIEKALSGERDEKTVQGLPDLERLLKNPAGDRTLPE